MATDDGGLNLLAWAPLMVTLVGWYIVNHQNNKREARKEGRAAADRCKDLATSVCELGTKYWLGQPDAEAWHIKAQLDQLDVEIDCFPLYGGQSPLCDAVIKLIDAITDGDFETLSLKPHQPTDPRIANIRVARNRTLREIERQFKAHFK